MALADAFTISQTLTSTGGGGIIFNKEDSYLLHQDASGTMVYGLKSEANPSSWIWINTGYKLSLNEEHTVSSVYDGATNTIKLYVDGGEVFSSTGAPSKLNTTADDLLFGERGYSFSSFQGTFDDIQIHNKALNVKEVATIANDGVISDGLVARYDFGGDTPLSDQSGNNHDASLQNGATLTNEGNISIVEDTQVIIKANTLLNNDTDEDADTLSITKVEATADTHGTVTLDANGDIVFIPEANYSGKASFTYTVSDGNGSTATATVNFAIESINDVPTLSVDSTATVAEDGSVSLNFTAQDIDGSTTTTATADNGTVTVNNDGTITYTPNTDYHGTDTITLTSTDNDGATVTATSTITVNDINDAPTLTVESTKTVDEDGSTTVTFTPKDTDGTIATTSATADNGTVTVNNDGTITYTPNTDYHGRDTITLTSTDDDGATVTATSTITVNDINDAPTLTVESTKTVDEDGSTTVTFTPKDTDGTIATTSATADNGTVTVNNDGTITYTPNTNYHGTDTITLTSTDDDGATVTATSTITVNDINDAPTLTVESTKTVDEDGSTTVTFTPKDTDGTITTTSATADNGTVVVNNDGTITYTPNTDYHGTDTITLTSTDDDGATVTATSTITVNDINDAPTLTVESTKTVDEDGSTTVTFTPKDTDGTIATTSATADNGTVVVNNDGTITYTPNTDYHGTDTITVTTTDDDGATVTATSTITVNDINDAPTLTVESTKTVDEDGSTTVTFTPKDTDGTITTTSATADNGTVVVNNDGTITYTPNTNYHGTDTITLTSTDDDGATVTATSTITVNDINDAPTLTVESTKTVDEDGSTTVTFTPKDTDGTITTTSATADNGTVVVNNDGTITYTPNTNYHGTDTITLTSTDDDGATVTATSTITVNDINDAPTLTVESSKTVDEDGSTTVTFTPKDTDGTIATTSATADNGTVTVNNDGTITYTPNTDYHGTDTITLTSTDDDGATVTATSTITVNDINDAPTITVQAVTTITEDGVTAGSKIADVDTSDIEGDSVTLTLSDTTNYAIDANGDIVLTQAGAELVNRGDDLPDYTLTANDGSVDTVLKVNPVDTTDVNDAVKAVDDTIANQSIDVSAGHGSINVGNTDMALADAFTISQTLTSTGGGGIIFNKEDSYLLHQDASGTMVYGLKSEANPSSWIWINTGYKLSMNEEHTVSSVYDGATNTIKLYVDGGEVFSSTGAPSKLNTTADDLLFGERGYSFSSFQGTFDDIQIHNKALNVKEVASIANDGVISDGLVARYDFGGDTPLSDQSGNNHDASLQNGATLTNEGNISIVEDTQVIIKANTLLNNDTDEDADTLSITKVEATADTHGTVTLDANGDIVFIPEANYSGKASFTYTVSDGNGSTATATVNFAIESINDVPTLSVDSTATVAEDGSVSLNFTAQDIDGSTTTTATADNGTVVVNNDGTITYTPNTDYHGTDTITVTTTDNDGATVTATSTITVNDINDAPTLTVESTKTVDEDGSTTVTFTPKDTDGTIATTSATADNGTVLVNNDGTITYTPNTNYHGTDTITLTSTDDDGATVTATSTITVNDINDSPTLTVESTKTVDEDGSTTVTFTPKDTDGTIATTSATADNGTVVVNNDGTITYTPNTDYHGTDTITLTSTDNDGATVTATSTITVNDINDAPTLTVESSKTVDEDGSTTVTFTPKDTDGTITTTSATADNGTVVVNNDGTITYTPNTDYHGTDTITVTSTDNDGATVTATSTITVNDINDAPTLTVESSKTVDEDGSTRVTITPKDTDGTIATTSATADNGTVTVNNDGTITYTPNADYHGTDTITLTSTDDDGATVTATSTITVNDINDAPTLTVESTKTVDEDGSTRVTFTPKDTDGTIATTSATADNGTVVVNNDGTITYTPNTNYHGTDTITLTSTDNDGATVTATSTITVNDINDAPTITVQAVTTITEDGVTAGSKIADVDTSDIEGDSVTLTLSDTTNYAIDANGDIVLTQAGAELVNRGDDLPNYTLTANDGSVDTVLNVNPVDTTEVDDVSVIILTAEITTIMEGSTSSGLKVATINASDEDNNLTLTLSDTRNYVIVGNEVRLTEAGADLVNRGEDLPVFKVDANGIPSKEVTLVKTTDVNDAAVITVTPQTTTITEGLTSAKLKVATISASDEDNTLTLTLSDNTNYVIVGNEVQLTQAGADLVNRGEDLPRFTIDANGVTSNTVNLVNTTDVNDLAIITVTPETTTITEGSTSSGLKVATIKASDEDDTLTLTVSDTKNYIIVGNEVQLTEAGADLVNRGEDLPRFTIDANAIPSKEVTPVKTTDVNDAAVITVTPETTIIMEGSTSSKLKVATIDASDEDDTLTLTLSDKTNYVIVGNEVQLTEAGADLVNRGEDLPRFTIDANGVTSNTVNLVNTIDLDKAAIITLIAETRTITEDSTSSGLKIATIKASDEDNNLTLTLSDKINYVIVGNEVQLTQAGADLVNRGEDLPRFTIDANGVTSNEIHRTVVENWSDNLVINGDAENGTVGWTTSVSSGFESSKEHSTHDSNHFLGESIIGKSITVYQDINISNMNGNKFNISADQGGWKNHDTGEVSVKFFDINGTEIGSQTSLGAQTGLSTEAFKNYSTRGEIPEGAVTARIEITMKRVSGGDADGYVDNILFTVGNSGSSVTRDVDDAAVITVTPQTTTITEGLTSAKLKVATISASDEDNTLTLTLSDNTNYVIVGNEVQLTQAGADLVNRGEDLPRFTIDANGVTSNTVNLVNTTDVNDLAIITVTPETTTITEGSTSSGLKVATIKASDEDDTLTLTVSDTKNYIIVGNEVQLTEAGADLVNRGEDLPVFKVYANAIPSNEVTLVKTIDVDDAAVITLTAEITTIIGGSTSSGLKVATISASDEDNNLTLTLSDKINYVIVGNEVQLTQAGADLVNRGEDLPRFTIDANGVTSNEIHRTVVENWSDNLVINGDAENGTVGWTTSVSSGFKSSKEHYTHDSNHFLGESIVGESTTVYQDINISNMNGNKFNISADQGGWQNHDTGEVSVKFFDINGTEIGSQTSLGAQTGLKTEAFKNYSTRGEIPEGAVTARVEITMKRVTGGDADGYVDNILFTVGHSGSSVTTVDEVAVITVTVETTTIIEGSTFSGLKVATINASDADDTVTLTLSDTRNYVIVGNEVRLTEAGADLVNRGEDLPVFKVDANGIPSKEVTLVKTTDVNDAAVITVTPQTTTITEGLTSAKLKVATISASDEDNTLTLTLSDNTNYVIVGNEVQLTQAGADLVNRGEDLPRFTIDANGVTSNTVNLVNTTDVNDLAIITVTPETTTITEGSTSSGLKVATIKASDEDDTLTLTVSDTKNYIIVGNEVQLTEAGADLVNRGEDLPRFTIDANAIPSKEVTPVKTTDVNDAAVITVTPETTIIMEGSTSSKLKVATIDASDEDDTLTLTLSDKTNYVIVGNEVQLTEAGADLVNRGEDLPRFTIDANGVTSNTVNLVNTTDVNELAIITVTPEITTIMEGSTSSGLKVATINASDEDNNLTLTLSDTRNYVIVGNEVRLTEAGADLVNRGEDLPVFKVDANGILSKEVTLVKTTDVNDAAVITVTPQTTTITEGLTSAKLKVATISASDEDNTLTLTLSDNTNYVIVGNEVQLTQAGADLVNRGEDLPRFTIDANGVTSNTVNLVNTTDVNDLAIITVTPETTTITEGSTSSGLKVATIKASDEDDTLTLTVSDTKNYIIVGNEVQLTEAGADLVNRGEDLPRFTIDANAIPSKEVTPVKTTDVNDAAVITVTPETTTITVGSTSPKLTVAIIKASDEDDTVTLTLSDIKNYVIVGNEVQLTQAGADLVNTGKNLPNFTVDANGVISNMVIVDFSITASDMQTAILIDGAMIGVEYTTSSGVHGFTDESGSYSFKDGDIITFNIGGVVLGSVTSSEALKGQTFLQDIANVDRTDLNDEYLENMASFVQSIDSDSGDNIVITQSVRDALSNANIDLRTASEDEVKLLVESIGATYVEEEQAMQHVQDMLEKYTGMDESEFDEHIDDSLFQASLVTVCVGVSYTTSSGEADVIGADGAFSYAEGDTITFTDTDGKEIASIKSSDIGTDNSIMYEELKTLQTSDAKVEEETLAEVSNQEVETQESGELEFLIVEDDYNIDLGIIDKEILSFVKTEDVPDISISIENVLDVDNGSIPLADSQKILENAPEEEVKEWALGEFKTDEELGINTLVENTDIVDDSVGLGLDINNTVIVVDQS